MSRSGRGGRLHVRYRDGGGVEHVVPVGQAAGVGFEDVLPIRRIPATYASQQHVCGRYWSATTGKLVGYESYLESKWMTMLDFDPQVVGFCGQPLEFSGVDSDGVWRHIPDLFARRADGSGWLLDVKNPQRLEEPAVARQARRTAAACRVLGWDYQMVAGIPAQRWANISWLAGFRRRPHAGMELAAGVLAAAGGRVTFAGLLAAVPVAELARPVVFHLCWLGRLVFDLDAPFRQSTLLLAAGPDTGNWPGGQR